MATVTSTARLDIGAAVSDSLGVIKRRLAHFLVTSVLLVVLPQYLSLWVRYMSPPNPLLSVVPGLVVFALSLAFQAGLFYATARDLDDEATEVGDMLKVGFKACLPLFALTLLVGVPAELGLVFLVAPGVLLFLRWCMAGPALVLEKRGVFGAMRRSAELTKGRRWQIFLAYLIVAVVIAAIEGLFITLAGGLPGVMALANTPVITPYTLLLMVIVSPVLGVAFSISFGVFSATLFHQLRAGRDGARTTVLAEVFA